MNLNAIVKNRLFANQQRATLFFSKTSKNKSFLYAGSLLSFAMISLLPLTTSGQCTPNNSDHIAILKSVDGCIQDVHIDLDGDGDFDLRVESNEQEVVLRASNNSTLSFAESDDSKSSSSSSLSAIRYGVNLPGAYDFAHSDFSYVLSNREGQGSFYSKDRMPVTGFLGFQMDNKYGFLELTISRLDDAKGLSSCISIGSFGVSSTQAYSIVTGVCSSLLPKSLEMKAQARESFILLHWEGLSATQNLGFELERSLDMEVFQKIGWMPAHTGISPQYYKYEDTEIEAEQTYFYRLKQMNTDGTFLYSDIASATSKFFELKNEVEAFPNPAQEYIQMRIKALVATTAKIQLFNHSATLVHSIDYVPLREGLNHMGISVLELSPGAYFLKIEIDEEVTYKRIVIL